jgi:hypothetical protein
MEGWHTCHLIAICLMILFHLCDDTMGFGLGVMGFLCNILPTHAGGQLIPKEFKV